MEIVAFYKAFQGHEWIEASIESIYNYVSKIVIFNTNINWSNQKDINTIKPVVEEWKKNNDHLDKIMQIDFNSNDQTAQYVEGFKYIKQNFKHDFIMAIDTDEVWDDFNFTKAIQCMSNNPNVQVFHTDMLTYVKSPFYRVDPPELCKPSVFYRNGDLYKHCRSHPPCNWIIMSDVLYHHFTYVRDNEDDIIKKIALCSAGEKLPSVDLNKWKIEKWDKLPNATNFHCDPAYTHSWQRCKVIDLNGLPFAVRNKPIVKKYML